MNMYEYFGIDTRHDSRDALIEWLEECEDFDCEDPYSLDRDQAAFYVGSILLDRAGDQALTWMDQAQAARAARDYATAMALYESASQFFADVGDDAMAVQCDRALTDLRNLAV